MADQHVHAVTRARSNPAVPRQGEASRATVTTTAIAHVDRLAILHQVAAVEDGPQARVALAAARADAAVCRARAAAEVARAAAARFASSGGGR